MPNLLQQLRTALKASASPVKALQMQAYMKSAMPYHGVPSPLVKKICRQIFRPLSFQTQTQWEKAVGEIWNGAKFREERYCALGLLGVKQAREFQNPQAMKLYERLIVTGAWWDYVDDIASHRVGPILLEHPTVMKKKMREWSRCDDLWKRRTSIIAQLTFKKETDLELLYSCIEPSIDSKEFFLRKAIGWALRQYAWTDPKEIKRYVSKNQARLSPLSQREALKNVGG